MMGRELRLSHKPVRIVSLVPSQTELLYHLGLEEEVLGITKFCIHPDAWFRTKTRVGGTKTVDFNAIRKLQPDIIIANKEENTQAELEALAEEYPVWISDVRTLDDSISMILQLGTLLGKKANAEKLSEIIQEGFERLHPIQGMPKALYLIWRKPYMTVNEDTFIHDMMQRCGLQNVCGDYSNRYPELSLEDIKSLNPDLVLLSSEPFPFEEKHISELRGILPNARIGLVDGEAFSWYGSRIAQSAAYFNQLLSRMH